MNKKVMTTEPKSDLFRREYTSKVVDEWDNYIDWQKRRETEGGFFHNLLAQQGIHEVLDIACGTGYHSITLAQAGFQVTGSDGSSKMVEKARENAASLGLESVPFHVSDWASLPDVFPDRAFDAVICLGNSFTHLFDESSRLEMLHAVYGLVREGGLAIIDQRNYDAMLDRDAEGRHTSYYLGDSVNVVQEDLSEESLRFRFEYEDGAVHRLTICPIRQRYLTDLLHTVGFQRVDRYGDFEFDYRFYEPEFIVQVAKK